MCDIQVSTRELRQRDGKAGSPSVERIQKLKCEFKTMGQNCFKHKTKPNFKNLFVDHEVTNHKHLVIYGYSTTVYSTLYE